MLFSGEVGPEWTIIRVLCPVRPRACSSPPGTGSPHLFHETVTPQSLSSVSQVRRVRTLLLGTQGSVHLPSFSPLCFGCGGRQLGGEGRVALHHQGRGLAALSSSRLTQGLDCPLLSKLTSQPDSAPPFNIIMWN